MERSSWEKGAPLSLLLALFGFCFGVIGGKGQETEVLLVKVVQGTVRVCSCPMGSAKPQDSL